MNCTHEIKQNTNEYICLSSQQQRYLAVKRVLDSIIAFFFLIVLLPVFIIVAIVIKLESVNEPVFFKQQRVGRNATTFTLYKFRSMKSSAPHEMATAGFMDSEQYITKVGKFLRKTSIDELPQLYNILKGEMSILGPRPLILNEESVHERRNSYGIYQVRPGLSGLAQVNGRDCMDDDSKISYDYKYVKNIGLKMDVSIFFHSISTVISRKGVVDSGEEKAVLSETKSNSNI